MPLEILPDLNSIASAAAGDGLSVILFAKANCEPCKGAIALLSELEAHSAGRWSLYYTFLSRGIHQELTALGEAIDFFPSVSVRNAGAVVAHRYGFPRQLDEELIDEYRRWIQGVLQH